MELKLAEDTPEIPEGFCRDEHGDFVNEQTGEVIEKQPASTPAMASEPIQEAIQPAKKKKQNPPSPSENIAAVRQDVVEQSGNSPGLKPSGGRTMVCAGLLVAAGLGASLGFWGPDRGAAERSHDSAWALVADQVDWCLQEVQNGDYEPGSEVACEIRVMKR